VTQSLGKYVFLPLTQGKYALLTVIFAKSCDYDPCFGTRGSFSSKFV